MFSIKKDQPNYNEIQIGQANAVINNFFVFTMANELYYHISLETMPDRVLFDAELNAANNSGFLYSVMHRIGLKIEMPHTIAEHQTLFEVLQKEIVGQHVVIEVLNMNNEKKLKIIAKQGQLSEKKFKDC
ncbi:MAG: hypothetical protein PHV05_00930 [Candidatus Riflebacteria bacterium]|nr:hypothetical protein [Candidatus Riflebacteria bacterium]